MHSPCRLRTVAVKTDNHYIAAPSAKIAYTAGGMPRIVHCLPKIERPVRDDKMGSTSLHCTGKVEDAGPTITAAYYRKSRKWDISQKQRALYQ